MEYESNFQDYLSEIPEFLELSLRHQVFVRKLLADPKRHGTNAAIAAKYAKSGARARASRILGLKTVKEVIKKYDEKISGDNIDLRIKIIKELMLIAFSDMREFMEWSEHHLSLKDSEKLEPEMSRVVSEVSETLSLFGSAKKLKLHDKLTALKELNKMHGFYEAEKHEISGKDGQPVANINVTIPSNGREKK